LLEEAFEILFEALSKAMDIVDAESKRLNIPKPNLQYVHRIRCGGEKLYGVYFEEAKTIYVSVEMVGSLLKMLPKKKAMKLTIYAFLHEFKHHVDSMRGVTTEEYVKNREKYESEAKKYAEETLKRYQHLLK
jgi:hypothetical protein